MAVGSGVRAVCRSLVIAPLDGPCLVYRGPWGLATGTEENHFTFQKLSTAGKIQNVELLDAGKMKFAQNDTALTVQLPEKQPSEHAIAFEIIGA